MKPDFAAIVILDGWGIGCDYPGNAVLKADTPVFDKLFAENPHTTLKASGLSVGLPEGQMGNSEVGHLNIGAGRVVYQEFTRISKSIENKDFFEKIEFKNAVENCKLNNSKLHLMGLLSPGGVHSHNSHLYALLDYAKSEGLSEVYIHCFLDGRDVPPSSGKEDILQLQKKLEEIGVGKIATVSGRYYAMDRDKRWDRTEKAYNAIVLGEGAKAESPYELVESSYREGITDEFIVPTVITSGGNPVAIMDSGDSVIFYNFRPDRARQITRAIIDENFEGFQRKQKVNVFFVGMTQYDATIENIQIAFKPQSHENTLGEYLSNQGKTQLRIAETEKYAHVTFFFNGGVEKENPGEDRVLIPSPKVATYDLKPEMSALELADEAVKRIKSEKYDFMVLNFANPDMVGHTGNMDAAVKALEAVDTCLGKVIDAINEIGGSALITADHGNAEEMKDCKTGATLTAHSTNEVPLILVGKENVELKPGILADIAPTVLDIMKLEVPREMTGESLIKR
jgi:2,3-bisphosphoglycerate-independent phosphoglycerate mutase